MDPARDKLLVQYSPHMNRHHYKLIYLHRYRLTLGTHVTPNHQLIQCQLLLYDSATLNESKYDYKCLTWYRKWFVKSLELNGTNIRLSSQIHAHASLHSADEFHREI